MYPDHTEYLSAYPVHHGDKVAESFCHGNVRNVGTPHGVCLRDVESSEEVGIDLVGGMGLTETRLFIDGLYAHLPHEGPHVDSAYLVAPYSQRVLHTPGTEERFFEMDLVDKPHDLPVGIIERARHVVDA